MEKTILFIALMAIAVGGDFLIAQWVCFGLAFYHVQSGIWGPFFLTTALIGIVSAGVRAGSGGHG
jgi:hypothetical protein